MEPIFRHQVLEGIYSFHREVTEQWGLACQRGCETCCTRGVVMTGLEGKYLLRFLHQQGEIVSRAAEPDRGGSTDPRRTFNQFAAACLSGRPAPPEPLWNLAPCPFLEERSCAIYPARPFACRALVSLTPCHRGNAAEVPPLLFTLNTMLMQVIEHLDQGGVWGNMLQILSFLGPASRESRRETAARLLVSQPCPGFLVPPGEEEAVGKWWQKLLSREVGSTTVGMLLKAEPEASDRLPETGSCCPSH